MKKVLSIALTLCMVLALSVTAFADEPATSQSVTNQSKTWATDASDTNIHVTGDTFSQDQTIDVNGFYVNSIEADTDGNGAKANYVVVLEWSVDSNLTYVVDTNSYAWKVWDGAGENANESTAAEFGTPAAAGYSGHGWWKGKANISVTVTNWSNRALDATFTYADKGADVDGIEEAIVTTNARTWSTENLTTDKATWTDNTGVLALGNPAKGVGVRAEKSANNKTAGTVKLEINSGTEYSATEKGTQNIAGALSATNVAIGTVTVSIANHPATGD